MLQSYPLPLTIDKERLEQTLEALPCPDHYIEVVIETKDIDRFIGRLSFAIFPAIRRLFQTDTYTLARVYVGSDVMSSSQSGLLYELLKDDVAVSARRVFPAEDK